MEREGVDYQYIIHIHQMGHTLGIGTCTPSHSHTDILIQPLYHITGRSGKSYIPVDALVFSCTVIRFPGSPLCVTPSFIFMYRVRSLPKGFSAGWVGVGVQRDPVAKKTLPPQKNTYTQPHKPSVNLSMKHILYVTYRTHEQCV